MDKDRNLIKNTTNGRILVVLVYYNISCWKLQRFEAVQNNDDHAGSTLKAKPKHQTVHRWWLVHLELASFTSTNRFLSIKNELCCFACNLSCYTIMSAPGHDYDYSGYRYSCTTGFSGTNLMSHTLLTSVRHVSLPFTHIGNSCQ